MRGCTICSVAGCVAVVAALAALPAIGQEQRDRGKPSPADRPEKVEPRAIERVTGAPAVKAAREQPEEEIDDEEMMAIWQAAATPGEHHKHLEQFVGEWNTHATFWMMPEAPPSESRGTMVCRMVFDGRFLQMDYTGEWEGHQFKGLGHWGYNNVARQYEGTWMDNMSTGMTISTGTCDEAAKVFTSIATSWDPMTSAKKESREVVTVHGKDRFVMQWFEPGPDGAEFKSGEIVYTRQGAAPRPATTRPGSASN